MKKRNLKSLTDKSYKSIKVINLHAQELGEVRLGHIMVWRPKINSKLTSIDELWIGIALLHAHASHIPHTKDVLGSITCTNNATFKLCEN